VLAVLAWVPGSAVAGQRARAAADAPAGCPAAAAGQVTCAALITPGAAGVGALAAGTPPAGFSPANLRDAYGFQSSTAGMRQTVAVIAPYDDPTAEADLASYRSQFSIPACTTADGCFSKVNQAGGTTYPAASAAWELPTAVNLDMISAVCPNCHILLVEAASPAISDVGAAENEAVSLGARFVTNTWITPEATYGTSEPSYDSQYFNHPGVVITAPDGNSGYGTDYPAASPGVIAVGGTTLTAASSSPRGWTETAWSGTGAGCSPYEAKPSWQADTGCTTRMLNDVSAVADPGTPIAAYDTISGGWVPAGGTSVAAAIIAAAYALAGTPAAASSPASYPYAHTGLINDITAGSDSTCTPAPGYFCTAGTGYDGPTGLGTPAATTPLTATGTSPAGLIRSAITGKCLDNNHGGAATNGSKVDIYSCDSTSASQHWVVESDGTIRSQGLCLDNHAGTNANSNPVQASTCDGSTRQQWWPRYPDQLENPATSKCLNDPSGSTTDGTQLIIFTCNATANEEWSLPYPTPVSSAGEIKSGITGKCLDNLNGGTADGNVVDISSCTGKSGFQNWTAGPDSTVQIQGKCLNNSNSGSASHNPVDLWTCNGHDAEQWIAQSDGSLLNPETSMCLDDPSSTTSDGTQIVIATCNETNAQVWPLPS
jgi:hypothetical protein